MVSHVDEIAKGQDGERSRTKAPAYSMRICFILRSFARRNRTPATGARQSITTKTALARGFRGDALVILVDSPPKSIQKQMRADVRGMVIVL